MMIGIGTPMSHNRMLRPMVYLPVALVRASGMEQQAEGRNVPSLELGSTSTVGCSCARDADHSWAEVERRIG